jgi:hypothetical protein
LASWAYFKRYSGTLAEYQTYKQANLTMVQAPIGTQSQNANAAGLGLLIGSWEGLWNNQPEKLNFYVNYPSTDSKTVWGYMLEDEPASPDIMDKLAEATGYIYRNDKRDALPIVNLLPSYGTSWRQYFSTYADYIDYYVDSVKPAVLCYDHYPALADGSYREDYYSNMEIIRTKSLENNIGMFGFVQSIDLGLNYRDPNEAEIMWQVNSLLTYGAKGIFYYNYRIDEENWGDGLVTHQDGLATDAYYTVQRINDELSNIGNILLSLKSTGIYHTGQTPTDTTAYYTGAIPCILAFSGDEFLLGTFTNIDDQSDKSVYLMITNKRRLPGSDSASLTASASLDVSAAKSVYMYDKSDGSKDILSGSSFNFQIAGGDSILLCIE